VPDFRLGCDTSLHSLLCLAIRVRESFVLAEVFGPRRDDEGFDVAMSILHIVEDAPPSRAIAVPNPSILTNRFEKLFNLLRSDLVFDCHRTGPKSSSGVSALYFTTGNRQ
jgi:hypothetical protein